MTEVYLFQKNLLGGFKKVSSTFLEKWEKGALENHVRVMSLKQNKHFQIRDENGNVLINFKGGKNV